MALFVFNRPETTRAVVRAVAEARPPVLYVVADGPRPEHPEDVERCRAVREAVDGAVDWPCEVRRRTSETNQGCGRSVASGVSWVLSQEDRAVFLEDDCVPHPTFFRFCDEILERHRDDPRVSQVCGHNRLQRWKAEEQSYHFAYYGSAWGWATWRRAWALFDPLLSSWDEPGLLAAIEARLGDAGESRYFVENCAPGSGQVIWDYAWAFAQIARGLLTVIPSVSLVANIGFGAGATHTTRRPVAALEETEPMAFPLRPPPSVTRDALYDHEHYLWAIGRPSTTSAAVFGRRLLARGRALDALAVVDRAWRTDPACRDAALVRAEALLALDRGSAAADVLDRLLAAQPGDAEARALRLAIGR